MSLYCILLSTGQNRFCKLSLQPVVSYILQHDSTVLESGSKFHFINIFQNDFLCCTNYIKHEKNDLR